MYVNSRIVVISRFLLFLIETVRYSNCFQFWMINKSMGTVRSLTGFQAESSKYPANRNLLCSISEAATGFFRGGGAEFDAYVNKSGLYWICAQSVRNFSGPPSKKRYGEQWQIVLRLFLCISNVFLGCFGNYKAKKLPLPQSCSL